MASAAYGGIMGQESPEENAEALSRRGDTMSALPYAKAFVVQFAAYTDPQSGAVSGRIEHLQTGRGSRFSSAHELLAAMMALLDGVDPRQTGP
jgi:hypothetical protein